MNRNKKIAKLIFLSVSSCRAVAARCTMLTGLLLGVSAHAHVDSGPSSICIKANGTREMQEKDLRVQKVDFSTKEEAYSWYIDGANPEDQQSGALSFFKRLFSAVGQDSSHVTSADENVDAEQDLEVYDEESTQRLLSKYSDFKAFHVDLDTMKIHTESVELNCLSTEQNVRLCRKLVGKLQNILAHDKTEISRAEMDVVICGQDTLHRFVNLMNSKWAASLPQGVYAENTIDKSGSVLPEREVELNSRYTQEYSEYQSQREDSSTLRSVYQSRHSRW